jgi:hypothetical protein
MRSTTDGHAFLAPGGLGLDAVDPVVVAADEARVPLAER